MVELEKLQKDHQEALKEVEGLKMDLATLPKHVIQETTDYKVLASQYSVLYNESMQMKTQLDEARKQLQIVKQEHIRHIEQMEVGPRFLLWHLLLLFDLFGCCNAEFIPSGNSTD